MQILISNDDGIGAGGLLALKKALDPLGEVHVVAPEQEQSGTGHGITAHKPLRPKQVEMGDGTTGWSVNGTPADCVKLAIEALLPKAPDIVISGINRGANLGTDVLYSGTVSAAIEGIINGIPSVAVSLATYENENFQYAAAFVARIVPVLAPGGSAASEFTLININVPSGQPRGVKITRLGSRRYVNVFHKRIDPRGGVYYWMAGEPEDSVPQNPTVNADVDAVAIKNNFISVTPLHFDLTEYRTIPKLINLLPVLSHPK
ncbi:MAG TPA: 5'/3'-nucleotidase SurE [Desulfotomaculum sp.]|nr:MAG: 5'-nucleotidase [Desulfotomaculum sp. BICA1-6]HBX22747.1 5'/3'-nucleotidase SurE [Desulfotomaculum sp.]